jgi:phosphatidylserine decarboxylase
MTRALLRLLTELSSRKFVSRIAGHLAKSRMSKPWISTFIRTYGIRAEDAEKQMHEYESLNDFFTRRLKQGLRLIDPDPTALISPVDAIVTGIGRVESGLILNVKGQDYTVEDLLNHSPRIENYKNGFYMVLYLSPTDYHRIHSPAAGAIVETEHIPGKVYPVNEFGLRHMRKVLSRNERLVTYIQHEQGELALVKVGAMNVSSIRYIQPLPDRVERGDELAYFEFGSTVVLLMENGSFHCKEDIALGSKVQMGQQLGKFTSKRNPI